jgi:hypothetical protein
MKPGYLGPLIVISRNRGGAYIVAELDGSVFDRPVAAFRLIPYFPRTAIPIPTGILDADSQRIRKLEDSDFAEDPDTITEESLIHLDVLGAGKPTKTLFLLLGNSYQILRKVYRKSGTCGQT